MTDFLIGIVVLAGMVVVVLAIVRAGRGQKADKAEVFREAASRLGFTYQAEDDGRAEKLAAGLGDFAVFRSPSLGEVRPSNVVYDVEDSTATVAFLHRTRLDDEGTAREWYVAITQDVDAPKSDRLIRILSKRSQRVSEVLGDVVVGFPDSPIFEQRFEVKSAVPEMSRAQLSKTMKDALIVAEDGRGFPVDVSLMGRRTAVVSASRNRDLGADELVQLVLTAQRLSDMRS